MAKTIRFAFDMVIFIAADSCYCGGDGNWKDGEESTSVRSWNWIWYQRNYKINVIANPALKGCPDAANACFKGFHQEFIISLEVEKKSNAWTAFQFVILMMVKKEIVFQKPAKLLQVFRQINEYTKEEKSFADRKEKLKWKEFSSLNGHVANGNLYLPGSILADKKFGNCDLITIEDAVDVTPQQEWKIINGKYEKGNNHCFHLHHRSGYEIFWLKDKDPLQLALNYNPAYIGDPSRDSFTIATLEEGCPVEVKINGKMDTSRGRYYKEQCFIFQLLGEFDRCFLLESGDGVVKQVPGDRKLVDLLKPLW